MLNLLSFLNFITSLFALHYLLLTDHHLTHVHIVIHAELSVTQHSSPFFIILLDAIFSAHFLFSHITSLKPTLYNTI